MDQSASRRASSAWTIGAIFAGKSLLRASNVSVIPIQAYDLLGSSQRVSIVATCVSFSVLMTVLALPYIFRGTRRRWVYSIGIALVMTAACLFAANFVAGQVMATYLRNAGASIMNITLALYIMENISQARIDTQRTCAHDGVNHQLGGGARLGQLALCAIWRAGTAACRGRRRAGVAGWLLVGAVEGTCLAAAWHDGRFQAA